MVKASISVRCRVEGAVLYSRGKNEDSDAAYRMLTKEQTAELASANQLHPGDTGSTDVQVAILSERISQLTDHLRRHRKDMHSQRGLMMLVGQRRGLLRYLSQTEPARYKALIARLGLRK
jgi:small subunit ribosomal protein S15